MQIKTEPVMAEQATTMMLNKLLRNFSPRIFEFGSGPTTVWLSQFLFITELISVSSSRHIHDELCDLLRNRKNITLLHAQAPYSRLLKAYPADYFDIVLVYGVDRVACVKEAESKLKPDGWIIMDNSDKEDYSTVGEYLNEWNRVDCRQVRPDKYGTTYPNWTTTIFVKPKN